MEYVDAILKVVVWVLSGFFALLAVNEVRKDRYDRGAYYMAFAAFMAVNL